MSEERETKPFKFVTAGMQFLPWRYMQTKGEDFAPCRQFFLAYKSLCPSAWVERWDDQRDNGTFPARLDQ
ncbi:hypothetical protein DID88_003206 [Monilinia fructigena]|uniref:Cytochrome c oxidase subunit n=1 Tax=Monilinia fructigena TaxID=38457 RepID=A0A395IWD0_9HELO|nr:hypothetical protein DID88_003206 [Monilinia fructigena]